jgi:hypothetical protein
MLSLGRARCDRVRPALFDEGAWLVLPAIRPCRAPREARGARREEGAEHERALARPRHPGEHREPSLGDLEIDVREVVHARAVLEDPVAAVGGGQRPCETVVPGLRIDAPSAALHVLWPFQLRFERDRGELRDLRRPGGPSR